jgi:hypothetical protein
MKNLLVSSAVILLAAASNAASASDALDPVGQWLSERTMQAAQEDAENGARSHTLMGSYRVVTLDELDAPSDVKEQLRKQILRNRNGVLRVPNGSIPTESELIASLPKARRSNSELRQRLALPPSTLDHTVLGAAESIGMEPSGSIDGIRSSGLTRFYRVEGLGIVEFSEDSYRVPGSSLEVIAEAQNTAVNGVPASVEMNEDAQGRSRVSLAWRGEEKAYSLIAIGSGDAQEKVSYLREIAALVRD